MLPCPAQACTAIKPETAEAVYLLLLNKSPSQEEFIRGQLTNNPYNTAEVGPLMRDVKNFICRELDMEGNNHTTLSFRSPSLCLDCLSCIAEGLQLLQVQGFKCSSGQASAMCTCVQTLANGAVQT